MSSSTQTKLVSKLPLIQKQLSTTPPIDTNSIFAGLSSRGRVHKELSSRKKYQASGLTKTERLKTASATGSGTNSPRPSIDSETESSEYTSSEEDSDYSSDDDEIMDLRTLEEVSKLNFIRARSMSF